MTELEEIAVVHGPEDSVVMRTLRSGGPGPASQTDSDTTNCPTTGLMSRGKVCPQRRRRLLRAAPVARVRPVPPFLWCRRRHEDGP
jgi:hypothetical protein